MTWQLIQNPHGLWRATQGAQQIDFVASIDNLADIDYQTVLLDLAKWDAYWQADRCHFVPADLSDFPRACCQSDADYAAELAMHQQKIQRWAQELAGGSGSVPAVCFHSTLAHQRLRIRQGRHRIAYLRSLGVPCFAAAIPKTTLFHLAVKPLFYSI
ncbi:hypothetical protein THMIRHAS_02120 [Thiosulfatimonas sediminis]|uniref:Uncharacterized protein n=1 Tax=Thiosulfatimonas sediminis TaxID=2675054 RepID=A0A6F8PRV3_9GAMM|nr:hypothetical protein [Thiosulfatimonas sediminis]BBP44839.1 hypothetical protein THMIRHAS_02120 [Thiosulfatimonas sediminis]